MQRFSTEDTEDQQIISVENVALSLSAVHKSLSTKFRFRTVMSPQCWNESSQTH